MRQATIALLLLLALAACQQQETATNTGAPPPAVTEAMMPALTPEQLGELGGLITNYPDRAGELLTQHNMTRESFEKAIREITENVDASRRYAAAYRKTVA